MISSQLEMYLNKAIKKANERKHEFLTLENVLLAILEDKTVNKVLDECGVNLPLLKKDLEDFIDEDSNFSLLNDEEIQDLGKEQFTNEEMRKIASQNGIFYQPEISLTLQRIIQRAALHVQSSGKKAILPVNLLVAMFSAKEAYAVYLLKKHGVERINVVEKIAHGADRSLDSETSSLEGDPLAGAEEKGSKALDEFTVNINKLAREGKIDPIIGREEELQRVIQVLCRRRKNNPVLVG
ncbi:MAG: Clp protease N-terminal domain-containing protein, partial [Bacteriovoracaceae bacterium]